MQASADRIAERIKKDFSDWGITYSAKKFVGAMKTSLSEQGFDRSNSRLVLSACPDDIARHSDRDTLEKYLRHVFDGEFHQGGLAGYPIQGVDGLAAASHHPPDKAAGTGYEKGNLIVVVNPHIGMHVDADAVDYGKVLRPGQKKPTTSCGAMMGFLYSVLQAYREEGIDVVQDATRNDLLNNPASTVLHSAIVMNPDYMKRLEGILEIEGNDQVIELAKLNYDVSMDRMRSMIEVFRAEHSANQQIALIGALTINTKDADYVVLRHFNEKMYGGVNGRR